MKLFGWMLKRRNNTNADHIKLQQPQKEEFIINDGLLTIGTFGNDHPPIQNYEETDLSEFTPEEVGKLQKELTKLLSKKQEIIPAAQLPLDRFLNCPSTLEIDRRLSVSDKEEDIDQTIKVILGRCRDICNKKAIGKKSISILFKKICKGFPAIPTFRDSLPESRMEKLLRTMLKNKIKPHQASSARKLIEQVDDNEKGGSKWVKTDSEYIVLEI